MSRWLVGDATDGRDGGAERTVRETLLEMERLKYLAGEKDQGAITLVLAVAEPLERVCVVVVWDWRRNSGKFCVFFFSGYFGHQRRGQFEGCVAEPPQTITAILPGSKWSCLLLRVVLQDASSEVMKVWPPLNLRVSVDDFTALMEGRSKELADPAVEGSEVDKKGKSRGRV